MVLSCLWVNYLESEMNKQELIDKGITEVSGIWPIARKDVNVAGLYKSDTGVFDKSASGKYGYSGWDVSKEEFQNRARELGWINGYQWGVEYPTNGKKPDLPDDLIVRYWTDDDSGGITKISGLDWSYDNSDCHPINSFKITDARYKPAEPNHIPEASKMVDWYDYENQRAIKLPPVGAECEYFDSNYGWESCKVLMHYLDGVIIDGVEGVRFSIYTFRPLDHATRKADIERKRVVGAALSAGVTVEAQSNRDIIERLYDKGYLRMPEDK
jgi:hypothetical protein